MSIALWIVSGLLAALYLVAGIRKLVTTKEALVVQPGMAWAQDYSPGTLRLIGAVEIAGALGLILPVALGIAPWLTTAAALGLTLLQALAIRLHLSRGERQVLPFTLTLLALSLAIAIARIAS